MAAVSLRVTRSEEKNESGVGSLSCKSCEARGEHTGAAVGLSGQSASEKLVEQRHRECGIAVGGAVDHSLGD